MEWYHISVGGTRRLPASLLPDEMGDCAIDHPPLPGGDKLDALLYHNLHLPSDVRVFTVPSGAVKRNDSEALVYDVRVGSDTVLRHYSWSRRWFEVNCTFSGQGHLVEEEGPIRWAFNCDISTPHSIIDGNAYNVDLELDVLVSADCTRYLVKDRELFAHASEKRWLTEDEAHGAVDGLRELLALVNEGGFRPFLESTCPFDTLSTSEVQPPVQRKSLDEVPCLRPESRRIILN